MRLINVKTFKLEEFLDDKVPPYAILSHTWGKDSEELTFYNVEAGDINKPGIGSIKFQGCCKQAEKDVPSEESPWKPTSEFQSSRVVWERLDLARAPSACESAILQFEMAPPWK